MEQEFTLTGLILAGGEGQRMGGVDKGLQRYQERPLITYSIELASLFSDSLVVSANRNIDQYRLLADRVVSDLEGAQGIGPLAGVLAAIEWVTTSHVLLLPCDTPKLSRQAIECLIHQSQANDHQIQFLRTESGPQPLHAVLPTTLVKAKLPLFLERTDHYGMMMFYREVGCAPVFWQHDEELDNLNYTAQLLSDDG